MLPSDPVATDDAAHADWLRHVGARARDWALQAAETVRNARGPTLAVQHKGAGDWASALDAEVEARLREQIAQAFPDHAFLGEEGGGVSAAALETDRKSTRLNSSHH